MAYNKYHYNKPFFQNPLPCGGYLLLQVGEMYCDENSGVDRHAQYCFEITYAVEGEGVAYADDKEFSLRKDDCFMSLDTDIHAIVSSEEKPLRFKFLSFRPLPDGGCEQYFKHVFKYLSSQSRKVNVPSLNKRFLRIFDELQNSNVFSNDVIGIEITSILIDIIRALEEKTDKRYPVKISNDNVLVFYVVTFIDKNVTKIKNLYELEKEFNYSYNYMSAVFKKIMNLSINDYFIKVKMNVAKELLADGLSVTEVSERLNYSSVHTFSRSFKTLYGQSPIQFRNKKS